MMQQSAYSAYDELFAKMLESVNKRKYAAKAAS